MSTTYTITGYRDDHSRLGIRNTTDFSVAVDQLATWGSELGDRADLVSSAKTVLTLAQEGAPQTLGFDRGSVEIVVLTDQVRHDLELIAEGLDNIVNEHDVVDLALDAEYDDHELQNVNVVMDAARMRLDRVEAAGGQRERSPEEQPPPCPSCGETGHPGYIPYSERPGEYRTCPGCFGSALDRAARPIRWHVVVAEDHGSAYFLVDDAIQQLPLGAGGALAISPDRLKDAAEVDFERGFEREAEAAPVREIEAELIRLRERGRPRTTRYHRSSPG